MNPQLRKASNIRRTRLVIPQQYFPIAKCSTCKQSGQAQASLVVHSVRLSRYEIWCECCGQCYEAESMRLAVTAWNRNRNPKIIQFPTK